MNVILRQRLIFLSIITLGVLVSCKAETTLPDPVRIMKGDDDRHTQSKITFSSKNDYDKRELVVTRYLNDMSIYYQGNITQEFQLQIQLILKQVTSFFWEDFGPPPVDGKIITIHIGTRVSDHAYMNIDDYGMRTIKLNSINFFDEQDHFVAHEMFHACYQTQEILKRSRNSVEAWATYAEYRYKYKLRKNKIIFERIIDEFSLSESEISSCKICKENDSNLSLSELRKKYMINALKLFNKSHDKNLNDFKDMINSNSARYK